MKFRLFHVDAFTNTPFHGNPAAVCPLSEWISDETLQAIAAENNLPETAFFSGESGLYKIRWFTPTIEVDLCGHATLASAFVVFHYLEPDQSEVCFESQSRSARRATSWLSLTTSESSGQ
jgi:PhzF family phenazine biosynthesis protein